jgi:hypothetical protein
MRKWLILGLTMLLLVACENDWVNRLPYAGPVEIEIDKGDFLPGTDIQYLGKIAEGAQVATGGSTKTEKLDDSLDWRGEMVRGTSVDQTLRVTAITEDTLYTAGTVRIIVSNPNLQAEPANTSAPVHFQLPVGYHVDKGATIPGTTITYLGMIDERAELDNVEGQSYRQVDDPVVWEGKLREGVWIQLDLKVMQVTDERLDVLGTADLWISP